jgi:hypothetical protein
MKEQKHGKNMGVEPLNDKANDEFITRKEKTNGHVL